MKKLTLIAFVLPFVVGCETELVDWGSFARYAGKYTVKTPTGTKYMSLDEALLWANSSYDLELLTDQFGEMGFLGASDEDRRKVERRREELQQEQQLESQQRFQAQEAQRIAEEEQIEKEEKARFEAWKANRAKFIENAPGSLKDMWAPEVKKLVDDWGGGGGRGISKFFSAETFFSVETFYKVFGRPESTQFISALNCYYFWYNCKDGKVQIQVDANIFDNNTVYIDGLNIF